MRNLDKTLSEGRAKEVFLAFLWQMVGMFGDQ